jgi:photosystem II stability/assembly factor-like uncharacterized protein
MQSRLLLSLAVLAFAACDRITSPSMRDAGVDSVASLWEQVDAGTVNYNAVAGSAPDNVFIVGDQGTILHWDGLALTPEASGTTANLRGVAVLDVTLAYVVGEQGTILLRQNGGWLPQVSPSLATLNAVAAWAGPVALAVGEQGTILTSATGTWKQAVNPRSDNYYALTDSNEGMLAVGALGIVAHIEVATGAVLSATSMPGYTKVLAGATRYAAGAFFVGVDGGFFYWSNGGAQSLDDPGRPVLPRKFLRSVSYAEGTAWAVGHEGLVARKPENMPCTVVPTPDDRWLLGVYAAAARDIWVVGRSGLIMRGPPGERGDGGVP